MALTKITARLDRTRSESLAFRNGNTLLIEAVVLVDADGNPIDSVLTSPATDLEGLGDIAVGTSQVEIVVTGTPTRNIRIRADVNNTGIIFIGKTGILSDGSNDYIRLNAEDECIIDYDDISNGLFAISDTAAQTINVGALL